MMNLPANETEREEWFLAQLGAETIAHGQLLGVLSSLYDQGQSALADSWAELLQDELIGRAMPNEALHVMAFRARRQPGASRPAAEWGEAADRAFEKLHEQRKLVAHAGFDKALSPAECFRRLLLLFELKPDLLCLDRTWGIGVVRRVDTFYAKVEIDFEKRSSHQLSLAYAAETLQILPDTHLYARLATSPDDVRKMVADEPAAVVRLALESLGPLTVAQLQDALVPRLLPADDWKRFWDAARKGLKKDNLVEVPAKRTEPLRLLAKEKAFDAEWFAALRAERDMPTVIAQTEELQQVEGLALTDEQRRIAGERLAFVVKGAGTRDADLLAQAVMAAEALGVDSSLVDVAQWASRFLEPELFIRTIWSLPARMVGRFMAYLDRHNRTGLSQLLLQTLSRLSLVALNEAITHLTAIDREQDVAAVMRESMTSQKAEIEFLYWMSRNLDKLESWSLGTLPYLARLVVLDIGRGYTGERLKVKNQLRSRFEQPEFLRPALEQMTTLQREEVFQLVKDSEGWGNLDRQSLLGQMIKMFPDLQRVLSSDYVPAPAARAKVTSERSYRERQKLLEKIVKVDIPQNSKEIAIARSYGDLSENHEFKAAKEMQGILMRRQGELEEMLSTVKPTDFHDFPNDVVGPGTGVLLQYADGRQERYHILGEWDQNPELGIISSDTRMAKALEGRKAGEEVTVPAEHGDTTCKVVEVTGLPAEVVAWIRGNG